MPIAAAQTPEIAGSEPFADGGPSGSGAINLESQRRLAREKVLDIEHDDELTVPARESAQVFTGETAKELGAGMIVMGTHGRTGIGRALLGSVAEKVVRTSTVPVLTIHPNDVVETRAA